MNQSSNVTDKQAMEAKYRRIARRKRIMKALAIAGGVVTLGFVVIFIWITSPSSRPREAVAASTLSALAAGFYLLWAYERKDKTVSLILSGIALVIFVGATGWAIFLLWLLYRADPNGPEHSARMLNILYVGLPSILGYIVSAFLIAFARLWLVLIDSDDE